MNKKAQGISLNVIIIAALALLVLVILSIIFLGRIGVFGKEASTCENKGGMCSYDECGSGDATSYPTENKLWSCLDTEGNPDPLQNCCLKIIT